MKLQSILALATSVALLAACGQTTAYNAQRGGIAGGANGVSKSDVGTALGAIGGGVAGYQFGKGSGKAVATAIGAIAGGAIGNELGASLDRADQTYYNSTQQRALETAPTGQALPWNNPQTGNSGSFTPSNPYQTSAGQYCREFSQSIKVGGKIENGYGTACRQADGSWQIVSQ